MFLVRLVYTSTISDEFLPEDIENILLSARKNNQSLDATGLLCFSSNYFLQCLEGSRTNVNKIYHQILNDPRHKHIIMLDYREIYEREFSQWAMGYVPDSSLTAPVNLKYSGNREFDPYKMTGPSAHQLLMALSKTIPVQ